MLITARDYFKIFPILNDLGRYSIIGLCPYLILEETDGQCSVNRQIQSESLLSLLKKHLKNRKEETYFELPLTSGAIGYFTYDYGRSFEHGQSRHSRRSHMPEALFCFYDHLIIADLHKKSLYLAVRGVFEKPESAIKRLSKEILFCVP